MEHKILKTYHNSSEILNGDINRGFALYKELLKDESEQMLFNRWIHTDQQMSFNDYKNLAMGTKQESQRFSDDEKKRILKQSEMIRDRLKGGE
jgi:hypothetical protein